MKKIIDNWLNPELVEFLEKNYSCETPHFFSQNSTGKNHSMENSFYESELNPNEAMNRYLVYKLFKTLKKNYSFKTFQLIRMYLNVQWPNMNGTFHQDDGNFTCIYMATKSRRENDGVFEIKGQEKIQFVQNRLVCFDAQKMHRGLAPKKGIRITLAFKTKLL